MKEYYLISTKWTYPDSAFFTFWGANNNGYCWYKEWAGVYTEEIIKKSPDYYDSDTVKPVPKEIVDKYWEDCIYDRHYVKLLPNTKKIRRLLNIKKCSLRGGMTKLCAWDVVVLKDVKQMGKR